VEAHDGPAWNLRGFEGRANGPWTADAHVTVAVHLLPASPPAKLPPHGLIRPRLRAICGATSNGTGMSCRGAHMGGNLACFPSLYPDEMAYSILARCQRHLGFPADGQLAESLFLGSSRQRTTALMVHVGAVAACLPSDRGLTASRLLRRHTLFPYLTAGMSVETRHDVARGMIEGSPLLYQRLGLRNHVPRPQTLRFCPRCLQAMASDHGELYWSRSHQRCSFARITAASFLRAR